MIAERSPAAVASTSAEDLRARVSACLQLVAQAALVATALTIGLGDIARVTPLTTVLVQVVHALPVVAIVATILAALTSRRAHTSPHRHSRATDIAAATAPADYPATAASPTVGLATAGSPDRPVAAASAADCDATLAFRADCRATTCPADRPTSTSPVEGVNTSCSADCAASADAAGGIAVVSSTAVAATASSYASRSARSAASNPSATPGAPLGASPANHPIGDAASAERTGDAASSGVRACPGGCGPAAGPNYAAAAATAADCVPARACPAERPGADGSPAQRVAAAAATVNWTADPGVSSPHLLAPARRLPRTAIATALPDWIDSTLRRARRLPAGVFAAADAHVRSQLATVHATRQPLAIIAPAIAWLLILTVSAVMAPSHRADALATLQRPALGVLLLWTTCRVAARLPSWIRLLRSLAIGGSAVALIALAEAFRIAPVQNWLQTLQDGPVPIGDIPRAAATLSHPNEAAMLLELTLPLLVAWTWTARSRRARTALSIASIATLASLVATFSRAGLISALLALALLAVFAFKFDGGSRGRTTSIALLALVVPVAIGWAALSDPGLDRRLLAGLDESSSIQPPRTEFWSVALLMARDHPLLGAGPDNFRWLFADYSATAEDNLGIHAHNQYFEALADTGALGLISLLWLLAATLRAGIGQLRAAALRWDRQAVGRDLLATTAELWPWRAALLASLSAWLVHALLDDFERFWPTSIAFWLIAGLLLARGDRGADEPPTRACRFERSASGSPALTQ